MKEETVQSADESGIEPLDSEALDLESSPASYEIVTYPADYTLEGLVSKLRKKQIRIPGFQRKYVWRLPQASRLIESFLLGLPVPAIFLYTDPADNALEVIDGQQRLLTILYYFDGFFGPEEGGKRTVFSLQGLSAKSPYLGKTYEDLRTTNESACNRLNDSVLRAFVVKQLDPGDNTSVYHVFERLNTGGTQLVSQEIRNCVYHGSFNDLLGELNGAADWRALYGKSAEDKRQRDMELILRFFALWEESGSYEKPMKDFLSGFMARHRNPTAPELDRYRAMFAETAKLVRRQLGDKPFHIRAGLNAAAFDAVFVAFAVNQARAAAGTRARYETLLKEPEFSEAVTSGTTDKEVVARRLRVAQEVLFS